MLVRFNVKNFLSFAEKYNSETHDSSAQEFSMLPGALKTKTDHLIHTKGQSLLRFAAIFGANAAGKSNMVKALQYMQHIVHKGSLPTGATEKYCKMRQENKDKPTYFELEMLIDDNHYSYGFEYNLHSGTLLSEWLILLSKNKDVSLFEKDGKDSPYQFNGELKAIKDLKVYASGIEGSNGLFLSTMNRNTAGFYKNNPKAEILKKVYTWITRSLNITFPDDTIDIPDSCLLNESEFKRFSDLMASFGAGIHALQKESIDSEKFLEQLPQNIRESIHKVSDFTNTQKDIFLQEKKGIAMVLRSPKDIYIAKIKPEKEIEVYSVIFAHKGQNQSVAFKISEESDGTARLFDLLQLLLTKHDETFVIDELDRCLHPMLSYHFVKTFLELTKELHVQLIVTTHESRLLDFDLLRRDEIWFVDKNDHGESDVYSLEEYNVRFDKKIDKAYLDGRYKGVPLFTTIYPVEEA